MKDRHIPPTATLLAVDCRNEDDTEALFSFLQWFKEHKAARVWIISQSTFELLGDHSPKDEFRCAGCNELKTSKRMHWTKDLGDGDKMGCCSKKCVKRCEAELGCKPKTPKKKK